MRSGMAGMVEVVLARRRRLLMMRRVQGVSRMEMLRPMRRSRLRVIRVVRMMARMLELGMVKMMCQRPVFGMSSNTPCVCEGMDEGAAISFEGTLVWVFTIGAYTTHG